jgi:parallel beta-helix repeat protein
MKAYNISEINKNTIVFILCLIFIAGFSSCKYSTEPEGTSQSVVTHSSQKMLVVKGYFVAKNGDDLNDGSEAHPWLTITKAVNTLVAGDTVYIRAGTYSEIVRIKNSGTAGNVIAIKGYPGEEAIIDGKSFPGWYGVLSIQGKEYISIENLEIRNNDQGWGVLVENSGTIAASNITLLNLKVHDAAGETIQIRGIAHDILVENCTVYNGLGDYSGIDIYTYPVEGENRPHHITVKGCTAYNFNLHGFPGAGIGSEQADDLTIINNTIYNSQLGIDIGSGDRNFIANNLVYSCETGIALSSNENSEVKNNIIHDILSEGIYCYYWSANKEGHSGNKWHDNIIYNINGRGIYESNVKGNSGTEGLSSNQQYYNNLFYNIGSVLYFKGTTELKFYNNTVYMNNGSNALQLADTALNANIRNNIFSISGSRVPITTDAGSLSRLIMDYNCYQNRNGTVTNTDAHSIVADPLFVNVNSADYHLQSSSPCINAGIDLGIPFIGSKPDMGAYETSYSTYVK